MYEDLRSFESLDKELKWLSGDHTDARQRLKRFHRAIDRVRSSPMKLDLGDTLFRFATSTSILRYAWLHLRSHGGAAPGPDQIRYSDFDPANSDLWDACKTLRDDLRSRTYSPGRERTVRVPKVSGKGHRTIHLQSIVDRVVQRSIAITLHPLLDPDFDSRSFGFRPNLDNRPAKSRQSALATAHSLAFAEDRFVWVLADIRDAFDGVPIGRLMDVVTARVRDASMVTLVRTTLKRTGQNLSHKRGLRQGGSLSPLLFNLYLDHVLDRQWRNRHPDVPLLRYADDLLLMCRDEHEANLCLAELREVLLSAGFQLKDPNRKGYIRNLAEGRRADWLGFSIGKNQQDLSIRPGPRAYSQLKHRLAKAHEADRPSATAIAVILGWFDQMGPTGKGAHRHYAYHKVTEIASAAGFEEIPSKEVARKHWTAAYTRWCPLRDSDLAR